MPLFDTLSPGAATTEVGDGAPVEVDAPPRSFRVVRLVPFVSGVQFRQLSVSPRRYVYCEP
jgi:hypothetical protein